MKKTCLIISFFAAILLLSYCSKISNKEKNDAKNIFNDCSKIAELWLNDLDKNGYSHLNTLKLTDLLKKEVSEDELRNYISNNERIFGSVKERKFMGAHIWLDKKMISYFPALDKTMLNRIRETEAKDGFYRVDPRYMGLRRSADMFRSFPDGDYVVLMYKSIPTNKPEAGEKVIFWKDNTGVWQVVSYIIDDDL